MNNTKESIVPSKLLADKQLSKEDHGRRCPLVSIITVVKNRVDELPAALQSVRNQTYRNIEYIVIDGESTDGTLEFIKNSSSQIDMWISEPDDGIYDAMNKGISLAHGDIVGIINSDDKYSSSAVWDAVSAYNRNNGQAVVYGDMSISHIEENLLMKGDMSDIAFESGSISINHPTCFVPRKLYLEFGSFDIRYQHGADRELMYRFKSNGVHFFHINKVMATFNLGGATSSYNLRLVISLSLDEYRIYCGYYTRSLAIKKSIKLFFRLLRNYVVFSLFGKKVFLDLRIKGLKRKYII